MMRKRTSIVLSVLLILVATGTVSSYAYITHNTATSSTTAAPADSTSGFPRDASGGWTLNFVGTNPTPAGCTDLVQTAFIQGYSLKTYVSSSAVTAGGLVCIDIVLQNVNGTAVTWGTSSLFRFIGYNLTDSSGRTVDSFYCHPTVPPPGQGPGPNVLRTTTYCAAIWDTSVPNAAGVSPQPGTYHITASAAYPGAGGPDSIATAQSAASVTVLPP